MSWLHEEPTKILCQIVPRKSVLIQPSVVASNGDSEGGAPTILLEAQACGVPIISTYHDDIPYATVSGGSALLSPERDIPELRKNIAFLFDNPQTWLTMAEKGRQHVMTFHNIKKEVTDLESLFFSR